MDNNLTPSSDAKKKFSFNLAPDPELTGVQTESTPNSAAQQTAAPAKFNPGESLSFNEMLKRMNSVPSQTKDDIVEAPVTNPSAGPVESSAAVESPTAAPASPVVTSPNMSANIPVMPPLVDSAAMTDEEAAAAAAELPKKGRKKKTGTSMATAGAVPPITPFPRTELQLPNLLELLKQTTSAAEQTLAQLNSETARANQAEKAFNELKVQSAVLLKDYTDTMEENERLEAKLNDPQRTTSDLAIYESDIEELKKAVATANENTANALRTFKNQIKALRETELAALAQHFQTALQFIPAEQQSSLLAAWTNLADKLRSYSA